MRAYEVVDDLSQEDRWAYACKVESGSDLIRWSCPTCGRSASYPSGGFDVVLDGGTEFPDLLMCSEYPLTIISEHVITALESSKIPSGGLYPVGIRGGVNGMTYNHAPRYYRWEPLGECIVDLAGSGLAISSICPRCGTARMQPPLARQYSLMPGSWGENIVFRDARYFPRVLFCAEQFVELVLKGGLSNFDFRPLV